MRTISKFSSCTRTASVPYKGPGREDPLKLCRAGGQQAVGHRGQKKTAKVVGPPEGSTAAPPLRQDTMATSGQRAAMFCKLQLILLYRLPLYSLRC